jgi:hypothetical protein
VNADLARFSSTASHNYHPGPYLPFIVDAQKATLAHDQAVDAAKQIDELMGDYRSLLDFLEGYFIAHADLANELQKFNSIHDLNTLQGSSETLRTVASLIDSHLITLRNMTPPAGLEHVLSQSIAAHEKAANGFRALASALSPPIDDLIYGAAGQIEAATSENEGANALLSQKMNSLSVINDLSELGEKVSNLKF